MERLDQLSKALHKDKSTIARELLKYGWDFLMLKYYIDGRLSLAGLARKLDVSISEAIDLLKERGMEAAIGFDDHLKGLEVLDKEK